MVHLGIIAHGRTSGFSRPSMRPATHPSPTSKWAITPSFGQTNTCPLAIFTSLWGTVPTFLRTRRSPRCCATRSCGPPGNNRQRRLILMGIHLGLKHMETGLVALGLACVWALSIPAQANSPRFKVIAFYTGRDDKAHISFIREANRWFLQMAADHGFAYDSTDNWDNLNLDFLANYQVGVFLDTRPEGPAQRTAFETYMRRGGGWMGFHFAGFALTPSSFPKTGTGITTSSWGRVPMRETPHIRPPPSSRWKILTIRPQRAYPKRSRPPRTNGTSGPPTSEQTELSKSCPQSTPQVFRWEPAQSCMRSGTAATIPSFGPTRNTGWSTSTWDTTTSC